MSSAFLSSDSNFCLALDEIRTPSKEESITVVKPGLGAMKLNHALSRSVQYPNLFRFAMYCAVDEGQSPFPSFIDKTWLNLCSAERHPASMHMGLRVPHSRSRDIHSRTAEAYGCSAAAPERKRTVYAGKLWFDVRNSNGAESVPPATNTAYKDDGILSVSSFEDSLVLKNAHFHPSFLDFPR